MFTGISESHCEQAMYVMMPSIERAAQVGMTNKFAGTMVVLDPRKRCILGTPEESLAAEIYVASVHLSDSGTVFYVSKPSNVGVESDNIYTVIARAKGFVTFKHRLPSSVVQQQFPYLYEIGDTKWGGSTIDAGGLIVAFSGVQAVYDEMLAEWMASAIRAQCRFDMTNPDGVMSATSAIIGT